MDGTWIIDLGKMIEMLVPLSLFLLALLSATALPALKPRLIPLSRRARRAPRPPEY